MNTHRSFHKVFGAALLFLALDARPVKGATILADGNLVACDVCEAQARRRVAVMPVNVGNLPARIETPSAAVAERLRDQIEARLARSESLIAVNRSHLDGVLAEQQLAASAASSPGGKPQAGRLLTAQLLLYATVERLDLSLSTEQNTTDDSVEFARQAREHEAAAADITARADRFRQVAALPGSGPGAAAISGVADMIGTIEAAKAEPLRAEAANLRARAAFDATRTVDHQEQVTVELSLGWRAIDASTGRVVASGKSEAKETGRREAQTVQTAGRTRSVTKDTSDSALVQRAVDRAVERIASQIDIGLTQEPFRARVAAIRGDEVILNAGSELGVRVGDVFGVRRINDGIVDPDTGMNLAVETAPVGALRVDRVQDAVAFASIVRRAGEPQVGDELEWVGLLVASEELAQVRAESNRHRAARASRLAEVRQAALQEQREEKGTRTTASDLFDRYGGDRTMDAIDNLVRK